MTTAYVIPCGAAKTGHAASAETLYTGAMFRHTLAAAKSAARFDGGQVLILSAEHGLIALDTILEPYDRKMGQPGSVTAARVAEQAVKLGLGDAEVYAFLPRAYLAVLEEALNSLGALVHNVYEGARGIGDQRAVNRSIIQR
jgi:hypothetical protein